MTEILIKDEDFRTLRGKHVVVTGCSSGIGLATVELLLQQGAIVTGGDVNGSPVTHPKFSFIKTDVTDWGSLTALFKHALSHHSTIDHVHANAGIGITTSYTEENLDANGDLLEPSSKSIDVNLRGVINTCALAIHYMRKQELGAADYSLVMTASGTSFAYHSGVDYVTAKHGVLGFMRSLGAHLANRKLPIRVNAIAPGWTETGMVPEAALRSVKGATCTLPTHVAQAVALFMVDEARNRQVIFSPGEKHMEIESVMQKCFDQIMQDGGEKLTNDEVLLGIYAAFNKMEEEKKQKEKVNL